MKIAIQALVILIAFATVTVSQVPGDFNCNGQTNGIDNSRYWGEIKNNIMTPIDTASCFWRNGDYNQDGFPATIADAYQLTWYLKDEDCKNNPEAYPIADSLIFGEECLVPGEIATIPIFAHVNPMASLYQINIKFDSRYLHNPQFEPAPESFVSAFICDTSIILLSSWPDSRTARNRPLGNLRFNIDSETPSDTVLNIEVYGGCYFPTGIGYYSIPTYFVPPAIAGGQIYIFSKNCYKSANPVNTSMFVFPAIFRFKATIVFDIPKADSVKIEICDKQSQVFAILFDDFLEAGRHAIYWHSHDREPGIYYCKLTTSDTTLTGKMYLKK